MIKKVIIILMFLLLSFHAPDAFAQKYTIDKNASQIEYRTEHKIGFSSGSITDFSGSFELKDETTLKAINLTIETKSISTHVKERDAVFHSDQFLDVANHPKITFKSKKADEKTITAEMTFKGKTNPVVFEYMVWGKSVQEKTKKPIVLISLVGSIDRKDFGFTYNVTSEDGTEMIGTKFDLNLHLEGLAK